LSNLGSALRDTAADTGGSSSAEALRYQAAERLAAHRSRRGRADDRPAGGPETQRGSIDSRAARIAAVVAERYAQAQSYRAFLAVEAERAVQQARAAVEVAALNAQAMLAAQQELLDTLERERLAAVDAVEMAEAERAAAAAGDADDVAAERLPEPWLWPEEEIGIAAKAAARARATGPGGRAPSGRGAGPAKMSHAAREAGPLEARATAAATAAVGQAANGGLRVRLYGEDGGGYLQAPGHGAVVGALAESAVRRSDRRAEDNEDEARSLDEEIAFRQAPVFEEPAGPPQALPANLIEFPRQLVASRKARPRLAEGPLRDDTEAAPGDGQLRIFEVDLAQIDTTPATEPETVSSAEPQWTSLWLDAPRESGKATVVADVLPQGHAVALPGVASIGRRTAAAAIDGGVILAGFLGSVAAFGFAGFHAVLLQGESSGGALRQGLRALAGQVAAQPGLYLGTGALGLVCLYLLYQALFFALAEGTPGMRCARIALCTFDEENPSRAAMLRRILAVMLSVCPLGLGFVWAALDEERLSWHDRVSRMYQRSY
jgi:uncharacterized RDD family membrane protein YckC